MQQYPPPSIDLTSSMLAEFIALRQEIRTMADRQTTSLANLSTAILAMQVDVREAFTAATTTTATLRDQIESLETVRDALLQEKAADDALIITLNETIQNLTNAEVAEDEQVASKLDQFATALSAFGDEVNPEPVAPVEPTPEPVAPVEPTPAPVEPTPEPEPVPDPPADTDPTV